MLRVIVFGLLISAVISTSELAVLNGIKDSTTITLDDSNTMKVSFNTPSGIVSSGNSGGGTCVNIPMNLGSFDEGCSDPVPMSSTSNSVTYHANKQYNTGTCTGFTKSGSTGLGSVMTTSTYSVTNSVDIEFETYGGTGGYWCCCYYFYLMNENGNFVNSGEQGSTVSLIPSHRGSYSTHHSYSGSKVMTQNSPYCLKNEITGNTINRKMYHSTCDSVTSSTPIFTQDSEELTDLQMATLSNARFRNSFGDCYRKQTAFIKINKIRTCGSGGSSGSASVDVVLSPNEIGTPIGSFSESVEGSRTVFTKSISESDISTFVKQSTNIASANLYIKVSNGGSIIGTIQAPLLFKLDENSIAVLAISISPSSLSLPITNLELRSETTLTCTKNSDYSGINTGFVLGERIYCKIVPSESFFVVSGISSVSLNGNDVSYNIENSGPGNEERFWFESNTVGLNMNLNATSIVEFSGARRLLNVVRRDTSANYQMTIVNPFQMV